MKTQMADTMAVPCSCCGQLFDLRYDLTRIGGDYGVDEVMRVLRDKSLSKRAMCWDCRSQF